MGCLLYSRLQGLLANITTSLTSWQMCQILNSELSFDTFVAELACSQTLLQAVVKVSVKLQ